MPFFSGSTLWTEEGINIEKVKEIRGLKAVLSNYYNNENRGDNEEECHCIFWTVKKNYEFFVFSKFCYDKWYLNKFQRKLPVTSLFSTPPIKELDTARAGKPIFLQREHTDCPFKNGSHFPFMRLSRYFLVKQPIYETKAVVKSTSPGKVFSCSLKSATDSAQRTFSDANPPTNRLASSMVMAVCSASFWHFSFSAVAWNNQ